MHFWFGLCMFGSSLVNVGIEIRQKEGRDKGKKGEKWIEWSGLKKNKLGVFGFFFFFGRLVCE